MPEINIYLSGSVNKGKSDANKKFWSSTDMDDIRSGLPHFRVNFLNPNDRSDDLNDLEATLGRDLLQVAVADLMMVDARDKRGIGVGAEMVVARQYGVPIITICPEDTHYRRRNLEMLGQTITEWIHPFVIGLSDFVARDLEEAVRIAESNVSFSAVGGSPQVDDRISKSISHYIDSQLEQDIPMKRILLQSPSLLARLDRLRNPESSSASRTARLS